MCRADVTPAAQPILAAVLLEMAASLARREGFDAAHVRIGPVDFGAPLDAEEVS